MLDDNVISFTHFRERKAASLPEPEPEQPLFEVHVKPHSGEDLDFPAYFHIGEELERLSPGERMREMANILEDVVSSLRSAAHSIEPDEDGEVIATFTIFASSKVRSQIHTDMKDKAWMERRLNQILEQNFAANLETSVRQDPGASG